MKTNRVIDCIIELLYKKPFVGYCLCKFIPAENNMIPTIGVSIVGGRIYLYYNKDFIEKLSFQEMLGVLEHELLHILHYHPYRRDFRDPKMFNIACDFAINWMITDFALPKGGCVTPEKWKNQSAEFIYEEIEKQVKDGKCPFCGKPMKKPGQSKGSEENQKGEGEGEGDKEKDSKGKGKDQQQCDCGSHLTDDHSLWDKGDKDQVGKALVKDMVESALGKSKGDIPGGWKEVIAEILKSRVNWKQLLKFAISSKLRLNRERSWKVRNRRMLDVTDFVYPGQLRRRGIDLIVAVDTSSSIDSKTELPQFFGEIEFMAKNCNASVLLIQCDCEVKYCKPYRKGDWKSIKITGRGGTAFEPVFKHIEKEKLKTKLLVYLTDAEGSYPNAAPKGYDVIWIVTRKNTTPPWGKVIPLDIEKRS